MNIQPKRRSALSDTMGACSVCHQLIRSKSRKAGYIEYYELGNKKSHLRCVKGLK